MSLLAPQDAARLCLPGQRAMLAGCAAEPQAIVTALVQDPSLWRDIRVTGAWIPGVNDRDFRALGQGTIAEAIFATKGLRGAQRLRHLPLHYSRYWHWLSTPGVVDILYLRVPPPGADGCLGLGIASDFSMAAIGAGAKVVGLISPEMPDLPHTPRVALSRFAGFVWDESPMIQYDAGAVDPATAAIADNILGLLRAGDTIQLGLGKVQAAVLDALARSGLRDLGFHGGMVSSPILPALEAGVFGRGVTSGVALGSQAFYNQLGGHPIQWRSVGDTHDFRRLASIPQMVSINSVLEVDLFGQANAEMIQGRQISGQGGLVDFLRGASAAPQGRAILALSATAAGGSISRIVPQFAPGTSVTVARADADFVVTEFGIAALAGLSLTERAEALIAIAAPHHRAALREAVLPVE